MLALLCCGEGWHNNHHHYQSAVNQGWFWWELDLSYYVLSVLSWFGIVWDLRIPPEHIKAKTIAVENGQTDASTIYQVIVPEEAGFPVDPPGREGHVTMNHKQVVQQLLDKSTGTYQWK